MIVLTGGVLGIITMRFVVRYFVLLLDRFPGLAEGAYFLVAWIGLKLVISGLSDAATSLSDGSVKPFHIPEILFWTVMVLIMIVSFLISPKQSAQQTRGIRRARPARIRRRIRRRERGARATTDKVPIETNPATAGPPALPNRIESESTLAGPASTSVSPHSVSQRASARDTSRRRALSRSIPGSLR